MGPMDEVEGIDAGLGDAFKRSCVASSFPLPPAGAPFSTMWTRKHPRGGRASRWKEPDSVDTT